MKGRVDMIFILSYLLISVLLYFIGRRIDKKGNNVRIIKNKVLFYVIQFTWGLPMNFAGSLVSLFFILRKKNPKRYGWYIDFELNINFGLNLGVFIFTPYYSNESFKNHECGHGLQNIWLGIFMPMVVAIPSALRFHKRRIFTKLGKVNKTGYYDIWFENQANDLGDMIADNF